MKTAVSRAMTGSRAENTHAAVPAAVPTAVRASCRTFLDRQNITIATRGTSTGISTFIVHGGDCVVDHGPYRCTLTLSSRYLHRALARAMVHRRCVEGYDGASTGYKEEHRGTVLGSEATSLAPCNMIYNPPQGDSPES